MVAFDYGESDRRKHKRISKQFALRLQIKGGGSFSGWDMVLLKDISRRGLQFLYPKPFKPGLNLELKINFGIQGRVIECAGQVIRCGAIPGGQVYNIGIEFVDIGPSDSEAIDQAAREWHAKKTLNKP